MPSKADRKMWGRLDMACGLAGPVAMVCMGAGFAAGRAGLPGAGYAAVGIGVGHAIGLLALRHLYRKAMSMAPPTPAEAWQAAGGHIRGAAGVKPARDLYVTMAMAVAGIVGPLLAASGYEAGADGRLLKLALVAVAASGVIGWAGHLRGVASGRVPVVADDDSRPDQWGE